MELGESDIRPNDGARWFRMRNSLNGAVCCRARLAKALVGKRFARVYRLQEGYLLATASLNRMVLKK
jgi:hypothetical protein